ncbi:metal-dependent hydrolase (plasmid) [Halococcus dombrowskii]|uniref:Metal-dependent hydrolase n=1 Tax=Halococcus dombrowskii TaxID=179637 RepID=A0AAV3SI35_HALDO|nr:metal-dependent hydrolase [Halococcus dombrowskii]UOO97290.1 metal-dependent hydrolase [Halococcus dombrowskii]
MNRQGHTGMTLLAFAPLAYLLASDGKLLLAGVCWLGIQAVEPLPDRDFQVPGLNHRGVSHSLLAVFVVGVVLGGIGWLLGGFGFDLLYSLLTTLVDIWDWVLGYLPELSTAFLTGLIPNLPPGEIVTTLEQQAGGSVNRWSFALFGFVIGAYGVVAHLLGDVITTQGIRPFLPFSRWKLSLSPLRADSPTANSALFGAGMVAIALVVVLTVPGLILGGGPAALPPIGVADAQGTIPQPTDTPSANATNASSNATPQANATVKLDSTNNTTATNATITEATLPDGGFVVLHGEGFNQSGTLRSTEIAASGYLKPGTHRNLTLPVGQGVPGGSNVSRLNDTRTNLSLVAYQDTNNDSHFGFIASKGRNDTPYETAEGKPVSDTGTLVFEGNVERVEQQSQPPTAALSFADQQLQQRDGNDTVVVRNVSLAEGGFIGIHTASFLPPLQNPLDSALGHSQYLTAGNYSSVTVRFPSGSLAGNQTLVAVPYLDTNGNQRYDYTRSGGETDYAYIEQRNNSRVIVNETAAIGVSQSLQATPAASTTVSERSGEDTTEGNATRNATSGVEGEQNGLLSGNSLLYVLGGILAVVVVLTAIGRLMRRG